MTKTARHELDVRLIPPRERHPEIFRLFDGLAEGESFVLLNDHDPRPLLYQFRAERPGTFQWVPIAQGPEEWRIEISRLRPKESETEIGAYFGRDHDEIDLILAYLRKDLDEAIATQRFSAASLLHQFEDFHERLERHIRWEEEILFPAVEERHPMLAQGPGPVMRMEHVEIRRFKAKAAEELRKADGVNRAILALDAMVSVLVGHNHKEESIYYPISDQMLNPEERSRMLARIQGRP